ncbi:ACT domain-containing protein [Photobacterium halotolerans]|uniref:Transporter n=1 Tax=Photobacterium halotolerans TaxID=265726 RepID=A0A0F5VFF0_9GAMM|nr:ACT domain-containing protein [Photobacterium halotolerans]KKD00783.1 transporter [Photobacterium halotolerans]
MSGIMDLKRLLQTMSPVTREDDYVFCTVNGDITEYLQYAPLATFQEQEGLTLVVTAQAAEAAAIKYESTFRCITLTVHSSLEAVGLTAAVSTALAKHGISANVIAAYYHDHVFVPADKADLALQVLTDLTNQS